MNEQLQESLAVLIEKSAQGVEAGAAFLSAELPDVVHQLLIWKASVSALSMVACIALCWVIYKFNAAQFRYWKKVFSDSCSDWSEHPELMMNIGQVLLLIPVTTLFSTDWLQILIAPKIYLIEYAASLVK